MNVNYYNDQLTFTNKQVETMVQKAFTGEINKQQVLELFKEDIERDMMDALLFVDVNTDDYTDEEFDQMIQLTIEKDFEEIGLEITKDFRETVAKELESRLTIIQNNMKNLRGA